MGDMDIRNWWKRVDRDSHAKMVLHEYIKMRPNETGKVWFVSITAKGKKRLRKDAV